MKKGRAETLEMGIGAEVAAYGTSDPLGNFPLRFRTPTTRYISIGYRPGFDRFSKAAMCPAKHWG